MTLNIYFFFDSSLSLLVFGFISFFGIIFLILSAFSGLSKYSMLGCFRLISQLLSYELVWSTIILGFIFSYGKTSALSLSHIFNFSFSFRDFLIWLQTSSADFVTFLEHLYNHKFLTFSLFFFCLLFY